MKKLLLGLLLIIVCLSGAYVLFPSIVLDFAVRTERNIAGLEQRRLEVDGLRFEYLEGGEGDALVLLHGFGANKDSWTRVASYLTPHFRVIAPDLTGFGESSGALDNDYRIGRQVERLHLFLARLGVDSFHLGGSSMGGYMSGMYAAKHGEQVKSLWLIAPAEVESAQPGELVQMLAAGRSNPLMVDNVEGYERLLDFVFTERPFIPRAIKDVFAAEAIANYDLHNGIYEQLLLDKSTPSLESLLKASSIPAFILWGDKDRVLHVSGAKILSEIIPDNQVMVLKGTGHLPMLEKPKLSAAHYLEFVKNKVKLR